MGIRSNGESFTFEIDPFRKMCLENGLDKIGLTLEKVDDIGKFESVRSKKYPWLDGASMKYLILFVCIKMHLFGLMKKKKKRLWFNIFFFLSLRIFIFVNMLKIYMCFEDIIYLFSCI